MKFSLLKLTCLSLMALPFLASTASAQMRTDCVSDPTKPGACFTELDSGMASVTLFCGEPLPTNNSLDDGGFEFSLIAGENDFRRRNPDGTMYIHFADQEVIAGYCTWESIFSGTCLDENDEPAGGAFVGTASVSLNAVLNSDFSFNCPSVVTGSGELTRISDGKTIKVRPTVKFVPDPDSPTGCRLQRCSFAKPGKDKNLDDE